MDQQPLGNLTPQALAALELMRRIVDEKVDSHKKLDLEGALNDQERRFVEAYVESCSTKHAGEQSGIHRHKKLKEDPVINLAIQVAMDKAGEESKLRAEYVREYIYDVLELCPTDHFLVMGNGDWCIDPEAFQKLPKSVKRLVENIEFKTFPRGETMLKVTFVSKKAALSMACKYTLVEKHQVAMSKQVNWDELLHAEAEGQKTVEQKLQEMRQEHKNGEMNGHSAAS